MSVDSAFQRLRQANPVPHPAIFNVEPSVLAVRLATVKQRSTEMLTEEIPTRAPAPSPVRRNWVAALATAVAVLIAGIGVLLATRSEPDVTEPTEPVQGVFEALGELDIGARFPVTLPDGTVLVFGGAEAEPPVRIFDPVARSFATIGSTATSPPQPPTPLLDGRVLLVGWSESGSYIAELFDPASGQSTVVGQPLAQRPGHAAVRLADGRVLFVGGEAPSAPATAEIFDPTTGTFAATGSMTRPRGEGVTATLLTDGRVLVAGGALGTAPGMSAELYDPATGTFTETGPMSEPRNGHTATLLTDGRVLLAGGYTGPDTAGLTDKLAANGDVYDPATGTFTPTGPMQVPRWFHLAALLRDGSVLIAGGNGAEFLQEGIASAEIFDPATNQFTGTDSLTSPRQNAGATVLPNGDILIVGYANYAGGPRPPDAITEIAAEIFR